MKILIDHNEPFLLAHGGFQILIEKTAAALRQEGLEVEYLRWWDPGQKGDIIHFFGRANPGSIHFAHLKGMKYVMHELLTSQGSRSRVHLRAQGMLNKVLRRALPASFRLPLRWDSYRMADAVIASTRWEAWIMQTLFDVPSNRLYVVPTGVDEVYFKAGQARKALNSEIPNLESKIQNPKSIIDPPSTAEPASFPNSRPSTLDPRPPLLTLATITERKRVVELAEAAILAQVPLTVIGKPYSEDDPYYLKFLEVVKSSNGLASYAGEISDAAQLAPILQSARGFVLLSTMETQSTAALAAAAAGCPLLLSDLPWARDTFGNNATYASAGCIESTAIELKSFYAVASSLAPSTPPNTWSEVARQLINIYRTLVPPIT